MKEIEELEEMIKSEDYTPNELKNKLLGIAKIINESENKNIQLEGQNRRQEIYISELRREIDILKTMIHSIVEWGKLWKY